MQSDYTPTMEMRSDAQAGANSEGWRIGNLTVRNKKFYSLPIISISFENVEAFFFGIRKMGSSSRTH
jgi:hypothetical protein